MNETVPKEVINAFTGFRPGLSKQFAGEITVEPVSGGLINNTFKISSEFTPPLLLQQINQNVFTNPRDVQNNYIFISQYAASHFSGLRLPLPHYIDEMESLFTDKQGNCWRACEFIEDGFIYSVADNPIHASNVALTFAKFTAAFANLNTGLLKETIPGFHNLSYRYRQFRESLKNEQEARMVNGREVIEELTKREHYKTFYESIVASPDKFPKRVMHHDAKITNVLFCKVTGKVLCPVDFDTVMPGYFFSDLGDMVRTMVCNLDETSTDFANISVRRDFYEFIISGYMRAMQNQFTEHEKKYIHYAGLLMIYMQALRFMTDYLNGDIYYRTAYPEQNLHRAMNQLTLLQKSEEFLETRYGFQT